MRLLASVALFAGAISALPVDSTISIPAVASISDSTADTVNAASAQGKEAAGDYGPPGGSYGGNYNYGPPPTPFPFQGGGYRPGQFTPPPPPSSYGNGYNGPAPNPGIAGGIGSIANGVGQLIGGATAGLVGGVSGEFLHGVRDGARGGYKMVKRETEVSANLLLMVGRRVAGWFGLEE